MLGLMNDARRSASLVDGIARKDLVFDQALFDVAMGHSLVQAAEGQMAHDGLSDGTFGERIEKASIPFRAAGENVAMGQDSTRDVFDAWMSSQGHRDNILSPDFGKHGFARVTGKVEGYDNFTAPYWTQVFTD